MACKICEKECPPQCIYIVKSEDKKPDYMGKPQFYPKVFDIDISVCMSCQICVEVCPFEAIKMDKEFELSKRERFDPLLLRKKTWPSRTVTITEIHPARSGRSRCELSRRSGSRREKESSRGHRRAIRSEQAIATLRAVLSGTWRAYVSS